MRQYTIHIGIGYQDDFPSNIIDDLKKNISVEGLILKTQTRPVTIYASLEWTLPTIIIAYLAKPYFDAFLKEAGKDHYIFLKGALLKLFKNILSKNKNEKIRKRSLIFSIETQTRDEKPIKFIFSEGLTEDEYGLILDKFINLMDEHYTEDLDDQLTILYEKTEKIGNRLYLEYSHELGTWQAINWREEVKSDKIKKK